MGFQKDRAVTGHSLPLSRRFTAGHPRPRLLLGFIVFSHLDILNRLLALFGRSSYNEHERCGFRFSIRGRGALASAIAVRFLSGYWRKPSSNEVDSLAVDANRALENSSVQCPFDPSKRKGYLSWDDYFMALAFLSAKRSKDPNRQVGACLVSQDGIILGIGYNGFPRGCSDDKLSWAKKSRSENPLETKYPYVCHAEVNAILNTNHASAAGQRLYVTMFPCNECAKIIIQSGVSEVIYFVEKRLNDSVMYTASRRLLSMAGVKVRKHQPQMSQILIKFEEP
ncbi:unnamed protein product [Spirodela intermedia]|uniref:dCMP deaminase n=1 Tax=Spirodela intermedia TaxID=51605 RepID=A0A7I8ISJ3_SPIIN|nr:unnamed protein product [Spirodela intermedia]CAA6659933.1 unnamed protein product [Spirodela intermedia]